MAYIIGPWVCVLLSVSLCVFGVCVCSAPSVGGSLQPLITADSLQAEPLLCLKSLSNIFYPPFLKFLLPFPPLLIKKIDLGKLKFSLKHRQTNTTHRHSEMFYCIPPSSRGGIIKVKKGGGRLLDFPSVTPL